MKKTVPVWKPVLIIVLVAMAIALVTPPEQKLRRGLDLAGGTRLIYQVEIPPDQSAFAESIIDDIIAVQRERVDPNGVMNLVWRRVGANRIEIQMPLADEQTESRRQDWIEIRDRIEGRNIDLSVISDFVLASGDREATMLQASGAAPQTAEQVRLIIDQRQAMEEASERRRAVELQVAELRFERENLPDDAADAQKEALDRQIADLDRRIERLAAQERSAREAVEQARTAIPTGEARAADLLELLFLTGRAHDVWQEALSALETAEQAYVQAREASATLRAEPEPDQQALRAAQTLERSRFDELLDADDRVRAARRALEGLRQAVESRNLDVGNLQRVLNLPTQPTAGARRGTPSPRAQELAQLRQRFDDRADDIDAALAAWDRYQQSKRGALDDPADLIRLLRGSGILEFRIVPSPGEVIGLQEYRNRIRNSGPMAAPEADFVWRRVDSITQIATGELSDEMRQRLETRLPEETLEEYENRVFEFFGEQRGGVVVHPHRGEFFILVSNEPGNRISEQEPGWEVLNASQSTDPQTGFPSVLFRLNTAGGQLMARLSGENVGRLMSIILDGRVMSMATIQGRLGNTVTITRRDGYTPEELRFLIRTLNAGSLAGRMSDDPISVTKVAPSAGRENLRRGFVSAYWALILVAIAMMLYYLINGVVTVFILCFNTLLILAGMSLIQGTFTLPGLAGIVLTIGMAVDANVLIFERIREELERKLDLKSAVKQGYEKALSTIVDANVTTLITCVVLFYTATAEVRGFALTLMIGVLASMFTSLFVSRVIFELGMQWGIIKSMPMIPTLVPSIGRLLNPSIDWLKARYPLAVLSVILMVLSVAAISIRGGDIFDIEFRSGTQVAFTLVDDQTMPLDRTGEDAGVRDLLEAYAIENEIDFLRRINVSVIGLGDPINGRYRSFSVLTTSEDQSLVESSVSSAFDGLITQVRGKSFGGSNITSHLEAGSPVFPIRSLAAAGGRAGVLTLPTLGEVIGDRTVSQPVPAEFLGGTAIVLDQISPAATPEEIRNRIAQMQSIAPFDRHPANPFIVIPLTPIDPQRIAAGERSGFVRMAVLFRDGITDYQANPDEFRSTDEAALAAQSWRLVREALTRERTLDSVTNFSSQVSMDMKLAALQAIFLSLLAVVVYIWVRFGNLKYGLAAIAALAHDVTIALGAIAVSGFIYDWTIGQWLTLDPFRIDLAMVAAILTLIGYSLNDTIVVFDRIRENRGKLAFETPEIINTSINQTISRTVLTSGTTMLALLTLYIFGGQGSVHGFAFAMIIGIIVGTYSSIAIAAPILMLRFGKKKPARDEIWPSTPRGIEPA